MNYRPWNHRCWFVFLSTGRLMLKILEDKFVEQIWRCRTCDEEFTGGNRSLIQRYVGREALWVHRSPFSFQVLLQFCNRKDKLLMKT
ncbi:hypothetical protein Taro_030084 [Colocasia esculenta]|uniref:Uncharacterized protein n=1 Tax=Colocasia esculenta TaxID=4460 RepID=A0A843W289_COLES|nr:hypothetical protein [Colocasia esculenta]